MLRTQIYLPEELHYQLACLAKIQETSVSEIIRKALTKNLAKKKPGKIGFLNFIKNLRFEGTTRTSELVDYFLYEQPYEQ